MNAARLLVVANHFTPNHGGTPESILLLARLLADQAVDVDVLTSLGLFTDVARHVRLPDGPDVPASARNLDLAVYGAVFVAGPWNRLTPVVVFRARRQGLFVTYSPKGGLVRIEFERWRDLKKLPYLALVEGPAIRFCHRLLYTSALECHHSVLPRFLQPASVDVLSEPFAGPGDLGLRHDEPGRDGPVFGFLAEIAPRKGLLELLRGFVRYRREHPASRATLLIAGVPRPGSTAYMALVEAEAAPLEALGWVRRIGARRGKNRDLFYRDIDIFVMPSRFESFGLTPLEAWWNGTPVVSSPHLGVLEFMPERPACLTLIDLEPASIAAGLARAAAECDVMQADAKALQGQLLPPFAGAELAKAYVDALLPSIAGSTPAFAVARRSMSSSTD